MTDLVHKEEGTVVEILEGFDRKLDLMSKCKMKALKYLKPADVVDQGGKPYILESGSIGTIAKGFSMSITDQVGPIQTVIEHVDGTKEIIFSYTANASSPSLGTIAVQGTCSTRDNFLGKAGGQFKDLKDIQLPRIMQKAMTNLRNNAVRHFMGLSNVSWDEIREATGWGKEACAKVEYFGKNKTKDLTPKEKETLEKIKAMTKEVYQGDKEAAQKFYVEATTFPLKDGPEKGKIIPGKSDPSTWSGVQITKIVYPKIKEKFEALKEAEKNG